MESKIPTAVLFLFSMSILLLITSSIWLAVLYHDLNDRIITHIDFSGSPDNWGDKIHLIYGLLVNVGTLLILFFLIRHPRYANYPVTLNDENRDSAYLKMRYFLSILAILTSLSFLWMIGIQVY